MLEMKNGLRTFNELTLFEALEMEPILYAAIRKHHEYTMVAMETRTYQKAWDLVKNHNIIWSLHSNLIDRIHNIRQEQIMKGEK